MHYGTKKELTLAEKNEIVKKLALGMTTLQISKQLSRDHHTVTKIVEFGIELRKKRNQSEFRILKAMDLSCIKKTNNLVFDDPCPHHCPTTTQLPSITIGTLSTIKDPSSSPPFRAIAVTLLSSIKMTLAKLVFKYIFWPS